MRLVLVIAFVLFGVTPVSALIIERDTLWTGEQSFSADVQVVSGVTLTVSPGTVVRFTGGKLEIAGHLVARDAEFSGDSWQGLVVKGRDASVRLPGCIIKGAKTGLFIQGGSPLLEGLTLSGNDVGIELRGKAAGRISRCRFVDNRKVGLFLKDDSTTAVEDCIFEQNGRYAAYLYHALPQSFRGNVFSGNAVGLMIAYHGSNPEISENRFERNEIAIQVDRAARPVVRGNLLRSNRTGLYIYRRSDPVVTANRIEQNAVGLLVAYSSYPQIEGNDFLANELALKLEFQSSAWEAQRGAEARAGETTVRSAFAGQGMRNVTEADRRAKNMDGLVDARGNWWGEVDTAELTAVGANGNPSFIHDGRDQATFTDAGVDFSLDKVSYAPWSEEPMTKVKP